MADFKVEKRHIQNDVGRFELHYQTINSLITFASLSLIPIQLN